MDTIAQVMTKHSQIGQLDRMAGQAIQTKEQYKEANSGLAGEDFEDMYRAYRAGYRGAK